MDAASDPIEPAGGDEESTGPGRGPSGRALTALALVVGAVVVVAVAVSGGGDAGTGGPTVACEGGAGEPLAQGLVPATGPDALPPGVLCDFDQDVGVDMATFLGGEPVLVNFWATWCTPCVEEMPDFQTLHEAAGQDLRLVGVNTQDAPPLARDFVADLGISYDLVRDPAGDYFNANAGFGMPTTLLVQPDGTIAYRHTGPLTLQQMVDLVAEHLGVRVEV